MLQLIPHKDHSAVVKLYTSHSGLISCWINSVHGKSSGIRAASLQPFTNINAVIDERETRRMPTLKEMQLSFFPTHISNTVEKSAIAIFIAELFLHTIKEPSPDEELYNFIKQSIIILNATADKCANFHVVFMLKLSKYLGILPKNSFSQKTPYLNLEEGTYQAQTPLNKVFLYPGESEYVSKLSALTMESFASIQVPAILRRNILHGLLKYFEIHAGTTPLKSHLVLEEVF